MRVSKEIVRTKNRFIELLDQITLDPYVCDTETVGLDFDDLQLGLCYYSKRIEHSFFVPLDFYFSDCMSVETVAKILNSYKHQLLGHNLKYDLTVLERMGVNVDENVEVIDDSILMIHVLDPDARKNLEERVKSDFGVSKKTFKEIVGCNWDRIDWTKPKHINPKTKAEVDLLQVLANYGCEDAYWTQRLIDYYLPKLKADARLFKVYTDIELPLVNVLKKMYMDGVNIQSDILTRMDSVLLNEMERCKETIFKKAGCVFNMNSPAQIGQVLYERLGYPVLNYTATGNPSSDKNTLEKLAELGFDVCVQMREYSTLSKLYSGYVNGIPKMLDYDGRLRGNFNSTGTKTGRFSSDRPNLQNQPNNSAYPVRKAFIATPGYELKVADYSQIELRCMAHVTQDPVFLDAFRRGLDVHQQVADDLGITRKQAKIVNFAVLYGMTYMGLAIQLKITEKAAKKIIQDYENTYKGFYRWKVAVEEKVLREHHSRTIFGRVRRMPYVTRSNMRNAALRQGVNATIQGMAADIIKLAMIKLHKKWTIEDNYGARILLQVHDELVCEAPKEHIQRAYNELIETMENVVKLSVPIIADGTICSSWDAMKGGDIPDYLVEKSSDVELSYLYALCL